MGVQRKDRRALGHNFKKSLFDDVIGGIFYNEECDQKMSFEEYWDIRKRVMNLKYSLVPTSLYKYDSISEGACSLKNLENNVFWLSKPSRYNDPYDSGFSLDVDSMISNIKDELEAEIEGAKEYIATHNKIIDIHIQDEILKHINSKKEDTLVCCFSETNLSILMWSHYANQHQGYCVEYNFKELGCLDRLIERLYPVIYSNDLFNITKYKIREWMLADVYDLVAIIKAKDWHYEKEWRIIENFGNEIAGNGKEIKAPIPKAIYLGAKMSKENKEAIKRIVVPKGIPLFQAKMKYNKFELYFEPVTGTK